MLDKQFKLFSFILLLFMLLSYLNTNQKKMIGGNKEEIITDEDPDADEPATDEPATDEPVADEPVADEPVVDADEASTDILKMAAEAQNKANEELEDMENEAEEVAKMEAERKKEEEAKKNAEAEAAIAEKKKCQIKQSVLDDLQNKIDTCGSNLSFIDSNEGQTEGQTGGSIGGYSGEKLYSLV